MNPVLFDRDVIERYIPQRAPFLFIDRIVGFEPFRWAESTMSLSGREAFFSGHFPDEAVMPGVLLLENMAQTANFLVAKSQEVAVGAGAARMVFGMVNRARFLRPVRPPAELTTRVSALKLISRGGVIEGTCRVAGEDVASAKLQFGVIE